MNNAARTVAHYSVSHTSHGWALVAENTNDGDGTLVGYFPTKAEAVATRNALLTLHKGR